MTTKLTAHDRCDRKDCGAQALVSVVNGNDHTLYFCGHDFNANEPMLIAQAFLVDQDDREHNA